ncbi:uncharacterized protein MELLADRAFT_87584 [Melampsora larici-populina 98AG31]|uniref:Uncharacterized protein n=1 Tax=Melampsora larici-populina (strain 98AG31 / pathotype 3-4-7) TaxID=747676 RepID=F4RNZ0_MELLP|nr:uncharacterized protein MELLADRAFT_87584 [Melampsora larici-populina 98AG31]EGG05730.1 hypothetical protein MELLADRAFT_87584 [Melampsora larici-populina 98AG31]
MTMPLLFSEGLILINSSSWDRFFPLHLSSLPSSFFCKKLQELSGQTHSPHTPQVRLSLSPPNLTQRSTLETKEVKSPGSLSPLALWLFFEEFHLLLFRAVPEKMRIKPYYWFHLNLAASDTIYFIRIKRIPKEPRIGFESYHFLGMEESINRISTVTSDQVTIFLFHLGARFGWVPIKIRLS